MKPAYGLNEMVVPNGIPILNQLIVDNLVKDCGTLHHPDRKVYMWQDK